MAYTAEQIEQMHALADEWRGRKQRVVRDLFAYPFSNQVAREMMQHGLSRRVADLEHGLERIFEILPPEAEAPAQRDIHDATAFLQAFVINVFGAVDNLAWVWAREAAVPDRGGRELGRSQIGLTPDHVVLRGSLSEATQEHLRGTDEWFGYLEEYRHALAHRVPLYIPPRTFDDADAEEFRRLDAEMMAAEWGGDQWQRLRAAQRELGTFQPFMMHSYGEGARPVRFHPQVVSDFRCVIEITEWVVEDLQALRAARE